MCLERKHDDPASDRCERTRESKRSWKEKCDRTEGKTKEYSKKEKEATIKRNTCRHVMKPGSMGSRWVGELV